MSVEHNVTAEVADVPAVGAPIVIQPVGAVGATTGTIAAWTSGPAGLVATSRIATTPQQAAFLNGMRVWASVKTAVTGTLLVFQGVAQQMSLLEEIGLTGIATIAEEPRRAAVRAPSRRTTRISLPDESVIATHTVDLSRLGARISVPRDQTLPQDAQVRMSLDLEDGDSMTVSARVLRSDAEHEQAVLQFTDLPAADRDRLEDDVLGFVQSLRSR